MTVAGEASPVLKGGRAQIVSTIAEAVRCAGVAVSATQADQEGSTSGLGVSPEYGISD